MMQVNLREFTAQIEALCRAELPPCDERYEAFGTLDPFPEIPPALLHSGHLASYAIATGMIDPFDHSKLTKPATYAVPLMGPCRYLDEKGRQHSFSLSNERKSRGGRTEIRDKFVLKPNSICYVSLEPYFRMPSYIAGRFNLVINNVYRGLLVGTGPLVDPGFNGYLSIPIHNFTTNAYQFQAGEDFVYFEFTKLSWSNQTDAHSSFHWCPNIVHDQPPFPASKGKRRSVDDYLANATGRGPSQSAIGEEIRRITQTSNATRRRLEIFSVLGVAGIAALVLTSWDIISSAQRFVDDSRSYQSSVNEKLSDEVDELGFSLSEQSSANMEISRRLDRVISELSAEVARDDRVGEEIDDLRLELEGLRRVLETVASSGVGRQGEGPAGQAGTEAVERVK